MPRKFMLVITALALLAPYGCKRRSGSSGVSVDSAGVAGNRIYAKSLRPEAVYAASPQRFVAISHRFEIVSSESDLQRAWQSVIDFCATLHCEVVSSSISSKTRVLPPSGTISPCVAPDDVKKLFAFIEKQGTVVQHSTQSEDKTSDVVDTEAKIKNLTTFRDNLRAMLAKPSVTVKDSVEIQQQLTDVQSQLDSETAQRKILANETEKVAVEIAFRVELVAGRRSGLSQIWSAFRESGDVLADSIYWMILAIVAILPGGILAIPVVWLLLRLWHRLRRRRQPPAQTA